jgi:hypothetical protein
MALYNQILPEFHRLKAQLVGISVDGAWCHAACQGRTESTSVAGAKIRQFEGRWESWFGFWQGEREGDLPLAIAAHI